MILAMRSSGSEDPNAASQLTLALSRKKEFAYYRFHENDNYR
jgi:hypothetical protein